MGSPLTPIGSLVQSALQGPPQRPATEDARPRLLTAMMDDGAEAPEVQLTNARFSLLKISMELHLERSVQDETGNVIGRETFDASLRYQRIEVESLIAGAGETPEETGADPAGDAKKTELPPGLRKLMEYFSPENTAQRIAGFVQKGFHHTSFGFEDTEGNRRSFVDFILPFVRKGMDSALSIFGSLSDDARQDAETTFTRVQELLEEFVTGMKSGEKASPLAATTSEGVD